MSAASPGISPQLDPSMPSSPGTPTLRVGSSPLVRRRSEPTSTDFTTHPLHSATRPLCHSATSLFSATSSAARTTQPPNAPSLPKPQNNLIPIQHNHFRTHHHPTHPPPRAQTRTHSPNGEDAHLRPHLRPAGRPAHAAHRRLCIPASLPHRHRPASRHLRRGFERLPPRSSIADRRYLCRRPPPRPSRRRRSSPARRGCAGRDDRELRPQRPPRALTAGVLAKADPRPRAAAHQRTPSLRPAPPHRQHFAEADIRAGCDRIARPRAASSHQEQRLNRQPRAEPEPHAGQSSAPRPRARPHTLVHKQHRRRRHISMFRQHAA
jgi:hypothetical protein